MNDDMPDVRTVLDVYERYGLRGRTDVQFISASVARVILHLENDRALLLTACRAAMAIDWRAFNAPHVYEQLRAAIERAEEDQ